MLIVSLIQQNTVLINVIKHVLARKKQQAKVLSLITLKTLFTRI